MEQASVHLLSFTDGSNTLLSVMAPIEEVGRIAVAREMIDSELQKSLPSPSLRRTMRSLLVVLAIGLGGSAHAANVLWNCFEYLGYGHIACYEPNGLSTWPDLSFNIVKQGLVAVTLEPYYLVGGTFVGKWVATHQGENVNRVTMDTAKSFFLEKEENDPVRLGSSEVVPLGESLYMMFAVGEFDYTQYDAPLSRYLYGWIEITVSSSGTVGLGSSAIDLDGDPIRVGVIPEPSAAVLLLVGGALLVLRRKREKGYTLWHGGDV